MLTDQCRLFPSVAQRKMIAIVAVSAAVVGVAAPAPAWASGHEAVTAGGSEAVTIYHAPTDHRRVELMNALSTSIEVPPEPGPRRRLSREERDALNQELREALRGAYRANIGPSD